MTRGRSTGRLIEETEHDYGPIEYEDLQRAMRQTWPDLKKGDVVVLMRKDDYMALVEMTKGNPVLALGPRLDLEVE